MLPENMVDYAVDRIKLVRVRFNTEMVTLKVPIDTTWVIREDNTLYDTNYAGDVIKSMGYEDYHKREWVDYEHYSGKYNKRLLGTIVSNVQFSEKCEAWKV